MREPDREQVPRGADLDRGAVGDPREHLVDVAAADQIRGGLEDAVQPLVHGIELVAEHVELLGGPVCVDGRIGRPADLVVAPIGAVGGARLVLDRGRLQPEEQWHGRHQSLRPGAVLRAAGEALDLPSDDRRVAGAAIDHLERAHGRVLLGGDGDRAVDRLRRPERPQQGRDRRRAEAATGLLADRLRECRVMGHHRAGPQERDRLVVGDPVGDVAEVHASTAAARTAQQRLDGDVPTGFMHPRDHDRRQRAREVVAGRSVDRRCLMMRTRGHHRCIGAP